MSPDAPAERQEFELKARLREPVDGLCARLEAAGWELRFRGLMHDRTYDTEDRMLEERDEVIRLRVFRSADGEDRAVLGWKGPADRAAGFKRRAEIETRVGSARRVREIIARLGFDRTTRRIDRRIHIYARDGVSARVEEYPRMDTLVELEGPPDAVRARMDELGLPRSAWQPWPLPEFVRRYEERTGRRARLARKRSAGEPAE